MFFHKVIYTQRLKLKLTALALHGAFWSLIFNAACRFGPGYSRAKIKRDVSRFARGL